MPINPKTIIMTVALGFSALINQIPVLQSHVQALLGDSIQDGQIITIEPKENESLTLPYKPDKLYIDSTDEQEMLDLINEERKAAGLEPLVWSDALAEVARAHSTDMWQQQYFAHSDTEGHSPFERFQEANIDFNQAGENLALARTLERAHQGLMHSEGHKRNILDPNFKKVGIGVIDGGVYGKMFTQDFTD